MTPAQSNKPVVAAFVPQLNVPLSRMEVAVSPVQLMVLEVRAPTVAACVPAVSPAQVSRPVVAANVPQLNVPLSRMEEAVSAAQLSAPTVAECVPALKFVAMERLLGPVVLPIVMAPVPAVPIFNVEPSICVVVSAEPTLSVLLTPFVPISIRPLVVEVISMSGDTALPRTNVVAGAITVVTVFESVPIFIVELATGLM